MTNYIFETDRAIHYCTDCDKFGVLFDLIKRKAGIEEAINATSWAELASVGETYEHELFTLTIERR